MDDTLSKVIGGIALAALSAVTFVAYKHPKGYAKLAAVLAIGAGIGVAGIAVWKVSNAAAVYSLLGVKLPYEKMEEVQTAIQGAAPSFWWLAIGIGINGYLWLLTTLPYWLLEPEPPKDQNNQE